MLEPIVGAGIVAPLLLPHLAGAARFEIQAKALAGDLVVAVADSESAGGGELHRVDTRAQRTACGYRLSGRKPHVLDGAEADAFILAARTDGAADDPDGVSLFLIDRQTAGVRVDPWRAADHRRSAALTLDGVEANADHIIGRVGEGVGLLREGLDHAIVARLAEALGAMDAAFEQTVQHLKTRRQFDQPLAAFQVLQHRSADMAVACEEARSITYLATIALASKAPDRRRTIAAAKARVSQTSLFVARQAVQLHGGLGFSDELAIGHYLKRLVMIDMAFGNAAEQRRRFVAESAAAA
jgi:alkylation response protein AidB-like acyl-CoA dehydrogenase